MPQPLVGGDAVPIAPPNAVGIPGRGMQHAAPSLLYLRGPHPIERFLGARPSRAQWLLNPCRAHECQFLGVASSSGRLACKRSEVTPAV